MYGGKPMSKIEYFRPRGVPGNYKVSITLDLAPTEEANVVFNTGVDNPKNIESLMYRGWYRSSTASPELFPTSQGIYSMRQNGNRYTCEFTLIEGGWMVITICDTQVLSGAQGNGYNATAKGIEPVPDSPPIIFQTIALIDKGSTP